MKTICATLLSFVILVQPLRAAENWSRPYADAMTAVEKKDWQATKTLLSQAIAAKASEEASTKPGGQAYVPYYWLGIAKLELGDAAGALRDLKESDRQGAIRKTALYSDLRTAIARANEAVTASGSTALSEARTTLDRAIADALGKRVAASTAGAARIDEFQKGSEKLQEAFEEKRQGTLESYRKATTAARQASDLFARAILRVESSSPSTKQEDSTATPTSTMQPAGTPPENTLQQTGDSIADPAMIAPAVPNDSSIQTSGSPRSSEKFTWTRDMRRAWNLYAGGDLLEAHQASSRLVEKHRTLAEAWLLRGLCKWSLATLQEPGDWMTAASTDMKQALRLDPNLRLDPRYFPPKLIAFFEEIR